MREIDIGLTRQSSHFTLRSEGRFMASEVSEIQASQPEPALQQVPAEEKKAKSAKPWERWGGYLEAKKGRPLSKAERRVIDMAIGMDIELPKDPDEVKDPSNEKTWQPNRPRDLILQFSDGFVKRGAKPSPEFIQNYIARIQIAVDKGEISPREGDAFTRDLNRFLAEAQDRQEKTIVETAAKIAAEAGATGKFEELDVAIQGQFKDMARFHLNLQVNIPPGGGLPPLPPGWGVGAGGVVLPPGGGGGQGGVPPGGQGAAGQGPQIPQPESEYVEQWIEYQTLKAELRVALGLDPAHPLAQQRKTALLNATPDLNDPLFDDLKTLMDKLDVSKVHLFNWMTRDITDLKTAHNTPNVADREVSEESRKLLFEWMYEKLIGIPDKGSPETHYKIGSFYIMDLLDKMHNLALEKFDDQKVFFRYISDLEHVRQVMHELNIALKYGDQYKEFVLKELSASGMHFVYNDVAGINQVFEAYEKVSGSMAQRKREWLSDADIGNIRSEVRSLFNGIPNVLAPVGMDKNGRRLTQWERDRALRMAEIFFAGTQRRGMYAFMGDLPPMVAGSARIASTQDLYIGRALMAGKITLQFFPGMKAEEPGKERESSAGEGSKALIKHIVRAEKEKSKEDKEEILKLFGFNESTIIFDAYGAYDLISHSWRSPKMFFDPIRFIDNGGNEKTLFEALGEQLRLLDPTKKDPDPVLGAGDLTKTDKDTLSQNLRDIVLGQRLYLSTFPRHGNFNEALKTDVWKKIALLKPSTIATLLPDSISDADKLIWEGMRLKLFAAELNRVKADAKDYLDPEHPRTMQNLIDERTAFEGIAGHDIVVNNQTQHVAGVVQAPNWGQAEFTQILHYMGLDNLNLTPAEQDVLQKIIKIGLKNADKLAKAKMPFTFMVDDAPNISWKPSGRSFGGLSDADYIRLLASDQQTLSEGWNEGFNSLVENPTENPIEHYKKVVTGYARVHGRDPALKVCRPFIIAWHRMAGMDGSSKWIPGVRVYKKIMDRATSEMEKYWKAAKISMNEEEIKNSVLSWAQAVAMSNPEVKKVRRQTGSDVDMMLVFWLRTVMAILPPAMAEEFAKLIIPKIK